MLGSVLGAISTVNAADFPEPAKLPIRADLPDPLVLFNGEKVTS